MVNKISRMGWAKIRRRVNELVDLGKTPKEIEEMLEAVIQNVKMRKGK